MAKRHLLEEAQETASLPPPCKQPRLDVDLLSTISSFKAPPLVCWNPSFNQPFTFDQELWEERLQQLAKSDFYKEFLRVFLETVVPAAASSSSCQPAEVARAPKEKKSAKSVSWSPVYEKKTDDYLVHLPYEFTQLQMSHKSEHLLVLKAQHKETLESHSVRRIPLTQTSEIKKITKSLILHRFLPHSSVNMPSDVYVRDGYLYCITETMDNELKEVVEDRTTHHCVAKLMHQLISLLQKMHGNGFSHGDISLTSTSMNDDITLKVENYGFARFNDAAQQWADIEACREILAHFLLEEESFHGYQNGTIEFEQLEWKPILESTADTGLTDFNAQQFLFSMGAASISCSSLLEHEYLTQFQKKKKPMMSLLERLIELSDENVNPDAWSKKSVEIEEKAEENGVVVENLINDVNGADRTEIIGLLNAEIGLFGR